MNIALGCPYAFTALPVGPGGVVSLPEELPNPAHLPLDPMRRRRTIAASVLRPGVAIGVPIYVAEIPTITGA